MNRVQTVTQKHYQVEKPGLKPSQVHEHPNWPSWHAQVRTGAPRHAHGHALEVVSWPGPGRVAGPTAVSRLCDARAPARCAARAMPSPLPALLRASQRITARKRSYRGRVPRAPLAVSWALTARCVVIQPVSYKPQVTIHFSVLRYTSPAAIPFSHDTVSVL